MIESELLDLLARVLQLEWVHESNLPHTPEVPSVKRESAGRLPLTDELRHSLIGLARMGNASGLRGLLRSSAEQEPAIADVLQSLTVHVDRFDFSALIERLKETEDES